MGLENSDGRLDELVNYIAPKYRKEKNEKELKHLYLFILNIKWDINIMAIARHLYEYSGEIGDYESKKKMLFWNIFRSRIMDMIAAGILKKIKKRMKQNKRADEWKEKFDALKEVHKRKKNFMALIRDI